MTIRKGEQWGEPIERPERLVVANDDAELAACVLVPRGEIGVCGGDVHRALGAPVGRPVMQRLTMDLLRLRVDGAEAVAVAHVIARRSWWRGPIVAVMNVGNVGVWNVAPRAHPNDGRFDVVEVAAAMSVRDRWSAWARLPLGTHVPHPDISVAAPTAREWHFDRPMRIWIDGVDAGRCRQLDVQIHADAYHLVV